MFVLGHFLGLINREPVICPGCHGLFGSEGMPATLTVSLALGVSYMAKGKVLIKKTFDFGDAWAPPPLSVPIKPAH